MTDDRTRPLLLTPGPLTTHSRVRAAAGADYGSRDPAFVAMSDTVRTRLPALANAADTHVAVPVQGSGTFGVEATLGTLVPRDGRLLVAINGAYGRRMQQIAQTIGRKVQGLAFEETDAVDPARLADALDADPGITHVAVVYCETTTGLLNPIEAIADVVAARGRELLIDAMSAFGALPLDLTRIRAQAVMASSNKCLEGIPGMAFSLIERGALAASGGRAHSLALDLHAQHEAFAKNGQWRFTPPTHVVAALSAALDLLDEEGGVPARGARYAANHAALTEGMAALGFRTLLPAELQAPIITTFVQPDDPAFDFTRFYDYLVAHDFAIYPGKLTESPTFRVGCIGQIFPDDIRRFLACVDSSRAALGYSAATGAR